MTCVKCGKNMSLFTFFRVCKDCRERARMISKSTNCKTCQREQMSFHVKGKPCAECGVPVVPTRQFMKYVSGELP